MWTPLSASRWIFLLTMGVVTLFLASEVDTLIASDCCYESNTFRVREEIVECYEQTAGSQCGTHAFWIKPKGGRWLCFDPNAEWLKKMISEKKIDCPKVLDEDAEA